MRRDWYHGIPNPLSYTEVSQASYCAHLFNSWGPVTDAFGTRAPKSLPGP
uniref:Uncharacterized protein n=1 Tax=Anguilla anguilla TaxID=7936 RepID=A0A0E9RP25_ANGAN